MMTHTTRTLDSLKARIVAQEARIAALVWSDHLGMLSAAGLQDAIGALPAGSYTVIFADINRLKAINCATGSHVQTNRYLRDGLRVRRGELAGQFLGDAAAGRARGVAPLRAAGASGGAVPGPQGKRPAAAATGGPGLRIPDAGRGEIPSNPPL